MTCPCDQHPRPQSLVRDMQLAIALLTAIDYVAANHDDPYSVRLQNTLPHLIEALRRIA